MHARPLLVGLVALVTLLAPLARPRRALAQPPERLEVGGRVYVRDTLWRSELGDDASWRQARAIDSARVFLQLRPARSTRMDLEVELAGDEVELKDTLLRYQPIAFLRLTVGRFKRPVSFLGLESTWKLPRIDRGLLSELRVDGRRLLFAGGRGEGLAVEVTLPGAARPRLTLTVHESDLAGDLGLAAAEVTEDVFARAEVEPVAGLHLAVAGGWVGALRWFGDAASYRHRPFGTVEAHVERGGLRVWAEGMAGLNASAYVGAAQIGRFAAAQGLLAPRLRARGALRAIGPYVALGWYEPSTAQAGDQLTELTAGLTLWMKGRLRVQLEGSRRLAQGDLAPAPDAIIARLQLGMAFSTEVELP